MRVLAMAIIALTILSTVFFAEESRAQTPEPSAEGTAASRQGLKHVVQVLDSTGRPIPDGTVIKFLNADIPPPTNDEEVKEAQARGYCAEATVQNGAVEITPEFTKSDCGEGTRIAAFVFESEDAEGGIAVELDPPIEWRAASEGETTKTVVARPIPPRTAGDDSTTIQPPSTGDAPLSTERTNDSHSWGFVAFGVAALLALGSLGVAIVQRGNR
jgi:hypothetical protein